MINDDEKKIEYLKYLLDKQLDWIQKSDTKASIFLSVMSVLITLLLNNKIVSVLRTAVTYLKEHDVIMLSFISIAFGISLVLIITGGLFVFSSIIPHLKSSANQRSHIYFGDIAHNGLTDLQLFFTNETYILEDLINQTFINARIAHNKMKKCNLGIILSCVGFFLMVVLTMGLFIGLSAR